VLFYPALLLLLVCQQPVPPDNPVLGGQYAGQPCDTLSIWSVSRDANGGNLSFLYDWGDGTTDDWTAEVASGETLYRSHVYTRPGSFAAVSKARDEEGLESGWSVPLSVEVAFLGPTMPDAPLGPVQTPVDTTVCFRTSGGHIRGDSLSFQFDWGEAVGEWGPLLSPGEPARDGHAYGSTGLFLVRARARDAEGNTSPWSVSTGLSVTTWPLEPPEDLSARAQQGVNVRLSWSTGRNHDSVEYVIWFRSHEEPGFQEFATTTASWVVVDPLGQTGDYTVSARDGSEELFSGDTITTIPVRLDSTALYELNTGGESAVGWDGATGTAVLLRMQDSASASAADCFFTDRSPGSSGPSFYLASPHTGPDDPGGVVPSAVWRVSGMLLLWGQGQEPLPEYDSLLYQDLVDVSVMENHIALHTQDDHYALLRTMGPDPETGTLPVIAWFQRVRGLRLLSHADNE